MCITESQTQKEILLFFKFSNVYTFASFSKYSVEIYYNV